MHKSYEKPIPDYSSRCPRIKSAQFLKLLLSPIWLCKHFRCCYALPIPGDSRITKRSRFKVEQTGIERVGRSRLGKLKQCSDRLSCSSAKPMHFMYIFFLIYIFKTRHTMLSSYEFMLPTHSMRFGLLFLSVKCVGLSPGRESIKTDN